MNFEQNSALPKRFATTTLPWLIGAGALVIYLVTMSKTVTFSSAGLVASVAGWDWHTNLHRPLLMFVLFPFRFLPESSIPLALNIFNAVLGALVLTLLARSIALLPQNRTAAQRDVVNDDNGLLSGRTAWIPPVLSALVLGLQITFWENATSMTGEMVDAFVVAYVIRCLLEFRIDDGRHSWLYRAAFLYAAGMTNNWALIGLAPVFLAAVIWMKGIGFFNGGFLIRMVIWSGAGLLFFYLLLPVTQLTSATTHLDFWPALKMNIASQWNTLKAIMRFYKDNYRIVVVSATSLLPIFVITLRWRSSFGDNSPLGIFIAKAVFHFVHALFLGICLVVTLSPPWSPRQIVFGTPFLTHAILGAIVIGYCAGYFLLICSPAFQRRTRMNPLLKFASYIGWGAVALMLVAMPVILVSRNIEPIQITNTRLVEDFAKHLERGLPASRAAILGDNPFQLTVLRAHMLKQGRGKDSLFYDTTSATFTDYHVFQHRRQPAWPANFTAFKTNSQITPLGMIMFLSGLATNLPVYYIQPSFGYYFERFQMIPNGVVYPIVAYPATQLLASPLSAEIVQANQGYWSNFDAGTFPVLKRNLPSDQLPPMPAWKEKLYERLHLSNERVLLAEALGRHYARASTYWGVELQKLGKWEDAAAAFDRALALNPDNVAAQINLAYNNARRKGEPAPADLTATIEDRFGKYGSWNEVMGDCGPFDEPRFTFEQSRTFLSGRLHRQALHQMKRVTELDPRNYLAHVWLADIYTMLAQPAEAMTIVQHIRRNAAGFGINATNELELARVETTALFRSGDTNAARAKLVQALKKPEAGSQFRLVASQLYLQYGLFAEALPLLERAIADNPSDIMALANAGYTCLQLGRYEPALDHLTRALEQDPKNVVARLNRAIVLLRLKQWDGSRADYEILLQEFPNSYQVLYGLGEIAAAKDDKAEAIRLFETAMKATPPGSRDFLQVSNRLHELNAPK